MKRSGVLVVLMCAVLYGCTVEKKQTLPPEKEALYHAIVDVSAGIKSAQYPIKRSINQGSNIAFLEPSIESLKQYKIAIIVLGSKPLDSQTPTADLVYRILKAKDMAAQYPNSVVVMTGGQTVAGISEAEMMGIIAWSRGMDTGKIVLEQNSHTTLENAQFCAKMFDKHPPLERVFLITRKDHLERASKDFRRYPVFAKAQGIDCGIARIQVIQQIQEYLKTHTSSVVEERLKQLQKLEAKETGVAQ